MTTEEYNLNNLCDQFQFLFTNIQDIRKQQGKVDQDNYNLQLLVDEELDQYKSSINNYKDVIEDVQIIQEDLDQNEGQLEQLTKRIKEKQHIYKLLLNQKASKSHQNSEEQNIENQIHDHMDSIRQEIDQMNSNFEQHDRVIQDLKFTNQEITQRIEEYQQKITQLEQQTEDSDKLIQDNINQNYQQNEDLKQMQTELRAMMRTQTQIDVATKDYEKIINKLWQELEKKTQRQQIIIQNQQQTQTKIVKSKENEQTYLSLREQNTSIATENVQIREQLSNFIKSLPQEFKTKINKSTDKPNSMRNSYTLNQSVMKLNDNAICQNHIKLKELQEVKNQQTKFYKDTQVTNIMLFKQEVEFLEQRLFTMKENIEILNQQYCQIKLKD